MADNLPDFSKYAVPQTSGSQSTGAPLPDFSKYDVPISPIRKYGAMGIRALGGLSPGGPIGTVVGGGTEALAELAEGKDLNPKTIALEAAIGTVPFGKEAKWATAALKGAALSGAGTAGRQQTEEGFHVPSLDEAKDIAVSTALGGVTAGATKAILDRFRTPSVESPKVEIKPTEAPKIEVKETPNVSKEVREVQQATAQAKDNNENLFNKGRPKAERIRKNDTETGKQILAQIQEEKGVSIPQEVSTAPEKAKIVPSPDNPKVSINVETGEEIPTANITKDESFLTALKNASPKELINTPKAIEASMDMSGPGGPGFFTATRPEFWQSLKPMFKSLKTANFEKETQDLLSQPRFGEGLHYGLAVDQELGKGEEQYVSDLASKIPLIGKGLIAPSERAYTSFVRNLRMRMWNSLTDSVEKEYAKAAASGNRIEIPLDLAKKNIADYINAATGRGTMGFTVGSKIPAGERAAELLNTVFFSPRRVASRFQLLNPASYVKMDPFTRKQYLRDLLPMMTAAGTVLTGARLAGADVTFDPREVDFGKVKVGNTRISAMGGFEQPVRLFFQTANQLASQIPQKDIEQFTKGAPKPNLFRFEESKLSPVANMVKEIVQGKDYLGKDVKVPKAIADSFAPLFLRDMYDLASDGELPIGAKLAGSPLSLFGVPTQTYGQNTRSSGRTSSSPFPQVNLPSVGVPGF